MEEGVNASSDSWTFILFSSIIPFRRNYLKSFSFAKLYLRLYIMEIWFNIDDKTSSTSSKYTFHFFAHSISWKSRNNVASTCCFVYQVSIAAVYIYIYIHTVKLESSIDLASRADRSVLIVDPDREIGLKMGVVAYRREDSFSACLSCLFPSV